MTPAAVNPENGQKPAVASRVSLLLGLTALLLAWRFWALPRLGITLYVDEAQYWTWAQQLDWGYFSKPPGIAALIWLSTALFGDGIVGVNIGRNRDSTDAAADYIEGVRRAAPLAWSTRPAAS